MTLVRRTNWPTFQSLMDDVFAEPFLEGEHNFKLPATNIKETEEAFVLELAAPGRKKEDFKIQLDENTLNISSEMKTESENKNERYTSREFSYQSFKRSFSIPQNKVDSEKISAKYEDGVLVVQLPKQQAEKPKSKLIAIF